MPVTGIGGLFFRSRDAQALAAWYRTHLGVEVGGLWMQQAGPTILAGFAPDTDYFPPDRQWMLNLRVEGLDALLDSLRAAGVAVITDPSWDTPQTGRFARIHDPEGAPIELWEPPPED